MMAGRVGWGMVALALLAPALAWATVGGPRLLEVAGWDPATKRVYVHEIPTDAATRFGAVRYFELDGREPAVARDVGWVSEREGSADDPELRRRYGQLRRGLRPLAPALVPSLPALHEVLRCDTLSGAWDGVTRYRVHAWFDRELDFEVVTYERSEVVLLGLYGVPGRTERLAVLTFVGDPMEGGYETQLAVLLRPGDRVPRVLP